MATAMNDTIEMDTGDASGDQGESNMVVRKG